MYANTLETVDTYAILNGRSIKTTKFTNRLNYYSEGDKHLHYLQSTKRVYQYDDEGLYVQFCIVYKACTLKIWRP